MLVLLKPKRCGSLVAKFAVYKGMISVDCKDFVLMTFELEGEENWKRGKAERGKGRIEGDGKMSILMAMGFCVFIVSHFTFSND